MLLFFSLRAGYLPQNVPLQTISYLSQETEFLPWHAASRALYQLDKLLDRTEDHSLFSVSLISHRFVVWRVLTLVSAVRKTPLRSLRWLHRSDLGFPLIIIQNKSSQCFQTQFYTEKKTPPASISMFQNSTICCKQYACCDDYAIFLHVWIQVYNEGALCEILFPTMQCTSIFNFRCDAWNLHNICFYLLPLDTLFDQTEEC